MSLLFTESFDMTTSLAPKWDLWTGVLDSPLSIQNVGRNSSNGLRMTTNNFIGKLLPARKTTLIVGFAWKPSAAVTNGPWAVCAFVDGAGVQVTLAVDSNHRFIVYRGDIGGTVLSQTGDGQFDHLSWHYYEVKIVIDNSAGSFELHRDETPIVTLSNVDTSFTNTNYLTTFGLGRWYAWPSNMAAHFHYDDVYICDAEGASCNEFLGEVLAIEYRRPNAAGDSTQWTPSAGANYQCVDEVPPSTADKISSGSRGNKDLYPIAALTNVVGKIKAVNLWAYTGKTGTSALHLDFVHKQDGIDQQGTPQLVGVGPDYVSQALYNEPGGGPLTIPGVNGSQFGVIDAAG